MKIMIFNTLFAPNIVGGAEKSVQLLAQGLTELGHQVVMVSIADSPEVRSLDFVKAYYVHHHNMYWGGMPGQHGKIKKLLWHALDVFNPAMYKEVKKIIRQEKPDIIHTNMLTGFSAAPWMAARKFNLPVVHTLREYNLLCEKSTMFHHGKNCTRQCFSCRFFTALKKYLSNHSYVDHVVGLSDFILERHRTMGYFRKAPSSRIFNGIKRAERDAPDPRAMQASALRILFLGRIDGAKGVGNLLGTVQSMEDIELYLGGQVLSQDIQDRIHQGLYPPHIKFLGFIDPEGYFPQVDVAIIPSVWHEPFGRVVIEAYRHGKPVIASNRGGLPEIVVHGKTGFLYDPDDREALAGILTKLQDKNILTQMAGNIASHLAQFDNEHIARAYEKIYLSL